MRIYKPVLMTLLLAAAASSGFAQNWDNSGNGLLKGTYYFRHVLWFLSSDGAGDLGDALTLFNTITFDGNGNYSISGANVYDAAGTPVPSTLSVNGTYTIAASGYGFMDNPASQLIGQVEGLTLSTPDQIYGLVSNGIFIGSSTENQNFYNDLFIAAPLGNATTASFSGTYAMAGMDSPDGTVGNVRDYLITGTADGNGNFAATEPASGFIAQAGTVHQPFGSVKYQISNGAANIHFGNSVQNAVFDTALFAGDHYVYFSPDGNFVFGGSPQGWDMFVGVKIGSSKPNYSGLFYQAGMDVDESNLGSSGMGFQDSYFSSFKAQSIAHQRVNSVGSVDSNTNTVIPYDYTFTDAVTLNSDGTADDSAQHYLFSANGKYRIGIGYAPYLGFSAALAGPAFSGSGLALDPTGLVNAGSNALFTARIAPGEVVTLYGQSGSTLGDGSAQDATFPVALDNDQVTVNGIPAPLLAVNECGPYPCVSFMIPYEVPSPGIATIQLFNHGNASNVVSAFVGYTAPGLFTLPQLGAGSGNMYYAATEHGDASIVSSSSPARVGETVAAYLTGLGAMTPSVPSGAPGPTDPPATALNPIQVYVGGVQAATVPFIGLTPTVVGLGQVNFTIPAGVPNGDNVLEIVGPDADAYTALISISGSTGAAAPAERPRGIRAARRRTHTVGRLKPAKLNHPERR